MNNLAEAATAYITERTTQSMTIEQQIMMAFAAGAVFGSRQVEAHVEAKYTIDKAKKVTP